MNEQTMKDIDRAFKALEERDELLGKIRAEIEQLPDMDKAGVFSSVHMKSMVLDIIDKYYEAESEKA